MASICFESINYLMKKGDLLSNPFISQPSVEYRSSNYRERIRENKVFYFQCHKSRFCGILEVNNLQTQNFSRLNCLKFYLSRLNLVQCPVEDRNILCLAQG